LATEPIPNENECDENRLYLINKGKKKQFQIYLSLGEIHAFF
jgi:hypothetical protein